jgi:hypothetical protein
MEQSYPLELESFSTKVKIVEGKLGVATEENESEMKIVSKCDSPRENVSGPVLNERSYPAVEEETRSFVQREGRMDCFYSALKRCYYSRTCECLHHCLRNFRICLKATLIVCIIAAGGFVLYQLWPVFQSIYAFFVRVYDFLKGMVEWVFALT